LQHPNIVTIYELGTHEGAPFMALERLEGMDLQQAIEAGIRPDPKITLPIVLQALAGLGHAHENGIVVHRDVKPSNIFLPRGRPAKIMDFGVARLAGGETTKKMLVGTPNYMSPEQARAGELDGRSDLFSVGLILYELVTGEKAYRGDTIVAVLFKIANEPPNLELIPRGPQWERLRTIISRALQRKPEDRYADARAMSADLQEALKELGGSADWMTPSDQAVLVRARPAAARAGVSPTPPPAPSASKDASPLPVNDAPRATTPAPSRDHAALAAVIGLAGVALLGIAVLLTTRSAPRPAAPPATPAPAPTPLRAPSASPLPTLGTPRASVAPPTPTPAAAAVASATLSAPSASPSAPVVSPAEARLERANDFMEKGRYAQALAEAKAVLVREPGNDAAKELAQDAEAAILVEEAVKKARAALKAGDREEALTEIRRGLAVNPSEGRLLALFREATQ
jgi:serine/threonine-protein kinase